MKISTFPGFWPAGRRKQRSRHARGFDPREGEYKGPNMPGVVARGKENTDVREFGLREGEYSTCPRLRPAGRRILRSQQARGIRPAGRRRYRSQLPWEFYPREREDIVHICLNMPGELTRGKEKIKVSTCPGIRPAGRRKQWS